MKNAFRLIGVIAIIAVITFSMTACPSLEDDDPTPETVTYSGRADGKTYTLTITENTGRYLAKNGDSYVLTVGTKTSSGTVTVNVNTLTLKPSRPGAAAFTVTVSSSGITAMSGTITFDDGTAEPAPDSITPVPQSGSPAPKFTGVQVYTLDNGTFTAYNGTGTAMDVKGFMNDNHGEYEELGKIGTISGDGKLTFEVPAIADDKLFLVPTEMGGNGTVKFVAVGIYVHNSDDSYYASLWLHNSSNTEREVHFVYFDRDFSAMGLSVKKGWNYFESDDDGYSQIIFDISSNHKWVIEQDN
jgi:hypothetical protein